MITFYNYPSSLEKLWNLNYKIYVYALPINVLSAQIELSIWDNFCTNDSHCIFYHMALEIMNITQISIFVEIWCKFNRVLLQKGYNIFKITMVFHNLNEVKVIFQYHFLWFCLNNAFRYENTTFCLVCKSIHPLSFYGFTFVLCFASHIQLHFW